MSDSPVPSQSGGGGMSDSLLGLTLAVTEVTTTLTKIQAQLDHCVPLALRLNSLLPENQRLEPFKLNPHLPPEPEPIDGNILHLVLIM